MPSGASLPDLPHGRLDTGRLLRTPATADDRARGGGSDAALVIVKYADFECGDCGIFHDAWRRLPGELTDRVRFIHRHFPLVSSRPRAMQMALAVEAAAEQGAFWAMYDRLFDRQEDHEPGRIWRHAEALGLDMDRFRAAVLGRRSAERIWRDLRTGRSSNVTGTPALFLGTWAWDAPWGPEALEADVRAALTWAEKAD